MVIVPAERRIGALTEEARTLLSSLPQKAGVMMPEHLGCSRVWMLADRMCVARAVPLNRESLLHSAAVAELSFVDARASIYARLRFPQAGTKDRMLVLIEPLPETARPLPGLDGFGLTRRQERVALLMILGKETKDIARRCGIAVNTAKEYVPDNYQRLDVHTRRAFLERMTGADAATHLGDAVRGRACDTCRSGLKTVQRVVGRAGI
jgi:DNA-binding CsgD family transcriptional regulator